MFFVVQEIRFTSPERKRRVVVRGVAFMNRWIFAVALTVVLLGQVAAQVKPEKALETFTVADGLELSLFASEPMFVNPTSIDVDHKGRVWVCEAVNYRRKNFG